MNVVILLNDQHAHHVLGVPVFRTCRRPPPMRCPLTVFVLSRPFVRSLRACPAATPSVTGYMPFKRVFTPTVTACRWM